MLTIRPLTRDDAPAFAVALLQIPPDYPSFLHRYRSGMNVADHVEVLNRYKPGRDVQFDGWAASIRVIENNHGVFESLQHSPPSKPKMRHSIDTAQAQRMPQIAS